MRQTNDTTTLIADVAAAIQASMRGVDLDHPASADVLAHDVIQALGRVGFAFVRLADVAPLSVALEPRNTFELPPGTKIQAAASPAVARDLVLFNCEDYEGNSAAAEALGLDSYPLEDPVTLGWLVDEHAAFKQTIETLFWDLTNGCVSKPNTSLDVVHELAGKACIVNLLEEHPKLATDPLFRPAMEQHFDAREISAAVEVAQLRLDGNRVVRVGTLGTFNLGKATA